MIFLVPSVWFCCSLFTYRLQAPLNLKNYCGSLLVMYASSFKALVVDQFNRLAELLKF